MTRVRSTGVRGRERTHRQEIVRASAAVDGALLTAGQPKGARTWVY